MVLVARQVQQAQGLGLGGQVLAEQAFDLAMGVGGQVAWLGEADVALKLGPQLRRRAGRPAQDDRERGLDEARLGRQSPARRIGVGQHRLAGLDVEDEARAALGRLAGRWAAARGGHGAGRARQQVEVLEGEAPCGGQRLVGRPQERPPQAVRFPRYGHAREAAIKPERISVRGARQVPARAQPPARQAHQIGAVADASQAQAADFARQIGAALRWRPVREVEARRRFAGPRRHLQAERTRRQTGIAPDQPAVGAAEAARQLALQTRHHKAPVRGLERLLRRDRSERQRPDPGLRRAVAREVRHRGPVAAERPGPGRGGVGEGDVLVRVDRPTVGRGERQRITEARNADGAVHTDGPVRRHVQARRQGHCSRRAVRAARDGAGRRLGRHRKPPGGGRSDAQRSARRGLGGGRVQLERAAADPQDGIAGGADREPLAADPDRAGRDLENAQVSVPRSAGRQHHRLFVHLHERQLDDHLHGEQRDHVDETEDDGLVVGVEERPEDLRRPLRPVDRLKIALADDARADAGGVPLGGEGCAGGGRVDDVEVGVGRDVGEGLRGIGLDDDGRD